MPAQNSGMRIVASAAAAIGALCLCLGMPLAGYAGVALLSAVVFHLSLRPSFREVLMISIPAVVFWAAYVVLFKVQWHMSLPAIVIVLGTLGAGSLTILSVKAVWSKGEERDRVLRVLFPAAGLLVFLILKHNLLNIMAFDKSTYDLNLFLADGTFGFHPAISLWKFTSAHHTFNLCIQWIYALLPVGMAMVYAPHLRKFDSKYFLLEVFFVAGLLGWLAYAIVPATGPLFVFGENYGGTFPAYAQLKAVAVEKVPMAPQIFRNAVPSLHMTWALLMVLNGRKLGWAVKYFAILFAVGTAMATMGTGQHFMVDLIVAVPFTLFIQAICTRRLPGSWARIWAIAGGGVLALAWMLMLREAPKLFLASIVLPWTCTIGTFAVVAVLFLRLEKITNGVFWTETVDEAQSDEAGALASSAAI